MGTNYPPNATPVTFGKLGVYYVWADGKWWKWWAPGNSGIELSQEAAMTQARQWMRDGIKGRERAGR